MLQEQVQAKLTAQQAQLSEDQVRVMRERQERRKARRNRARAPEVDDDDDQGAPSPRLVEEQAEQERKLKAQKVRACTVLRCLNNMSVVTSCYICRLK